MQLAMIGLGRMGANMTRRLSADGHQLIVFDRDSDVTSSVAKETGSRAAVSFDKAIESLSSPRIVWVMLPHGEPTELALEKLQQLLDPGDIIIDGGNSRYSSSIERACRFAEKDIYFLDVGTSGGIFGLARGYCLMIGGAPAAVERATPIFRSLAPGYDSAAPTPGRPPKTQADPEEEGWLHCGPSGAGHFTKMVHNGIEYGMMQSFAEGFALCTAAGDSPEFSTDGFDLDLARIAELWRRGSVVTSWVLDLLAEALNADPYLASYSPQVADSGEGRWTVESAVEHAVPVPVLTAALFSRFRSRQQDTTEGRALSAMRHKFGGHPSKIPPK